MTSILSTIMKIESGGKNVPQAIDDINMRNGTPAQGYFQIINPTWSGFGGDKSGYKSAIDAPYATQLQVAQNIPVSHWGPATQQALKAAGYEPQPGETLGAMLARYKEDPNATRPEDVGGSSDSGTKPTTPTAPTGGLTPEVIAGLLAKQQDQSAATAKAAALAEEAKQQAGMQSLIKQGTGLLASADTPAPQMAVPQAPIHRPQAQPFSLGGDTPDFSTMLARQRLMRRA